MGANVRGTVITARKSFVLERFGAAALARIVASLPPGDRELVGGSLLPTEWYPVETAARFDAAILSVMGGASERALWELGRASATENLAKFQASFVRGKSPLGLLLQTPAIYRLYYETGHREFIPRGTHGGVIVTHEASGVTAADCFTVMGWHERALEMVGATSIKIVHPICRARDGAVCRYELAWS